MSSDERGRSPENIGSDLRTRGGLSLGVSRLALASGLSAVAVTTDRRWSSLDLDVEIRVVR